MEIWKEFEANPLTHSATHYLFAVYDLAQNPGYARITDVAKKLGIARSSASLGLKNLVEKSLIQEDNNKFLHLTQAGKQLTEEIRNKKQVLLRFFQDILKIDPEQADIDTCKIEHLISLDTSNSLLGFIRYLSSKDSTPKKALEKFWELKEKCSGKDNCLLCEKTNLEK